MKKIDIQKNQKTEKGIDCQRIERKTRLERRKGWIGRGWRGRGWRGWRGRGWRGRGWISRREDQLRKDRLNSNSLLGKDNVNPNNKNNAMIRFQPKSKGKLLKNLNNQNMLKNEL